MIRVMVVDDSALVRKIATDILSADPEITVVATASMAEFALQKLDRERPDVITLDMEMPGMGGLEAIRRFMSMRPTPIIVLSAHARKGADLTLQALDLGAVDFVLKPSNTLSGGIPAIAQELTEKVKSAAKIVFHGASLPAVQYETQIGRASCRERVSMFV
jgi:two-component system, chemotaxis family, protein-glutamate methylesterase/glutaminase